MHYTLAYVFNSKAERIDFAENFMSVQCMKRLMAVINKDTTLKKLNYFTKTENLSAYIISSAEPT